MTDGLASQVARARRTIKGWPEWMKVTTSFNTGDNIMAKNSYKNYTAEFKAKILAEVAEKQLSIPKIAEKHGLSNSLIYVWLGRTEKSGASKKSEKTFTGAIHPHPSATRETVLKDVATGMTIRAAAIKNGVHPSTVYGWTRGKRARVNGMSQTTETYKLAKNDDYVRDVAIWLRNARTIVNEDLRAGKFKNYDRSQLLMMLALSELEKNGH